MEIIYFIISVVGIGFFMLLFSAPVIAILNYYNKRKFGNDYKNNTRDFVITYSIVATFFLAFGYFNNRVSIVISILVPVALLFIFFKYKKSKDFLEKKLLFLKYTIYRRFQEPHPNSEIPHSIEKDFDNPNRAKNRIKSISENHYVRLIKNSRFIKGNLLKESKTNFDNYGQCIESFTNGIFFGLNHHSIFKINDKGLIIEIHSFSNEKKLQNITYHCYNKSKKLIEITVKDCNSNLKSKENFVYSESDILLEEIHYDENLEIVYKMVHSYDEKRNKVKTEEIRNDEITRTISYKYNLNSNLIEEFYSNEYYISIKVFVYDRVGKLIEKNESQFTSESISESKTNYDINGNKIRFYECYNDYNQNKITSNIHTYLYDKKNNIREITNIQGYQNYSFYENNTDEMKSIYSGNILYDLKGDIRKCLIPKYDLSKVIQYFDTDGFEFERKEYDRNNVFIDSEKFEKQETKEPYYDSIKTYNKKENFTKEIGYTLMDGKTCIVERFVEYFDK
ncbi:hypothetical protein [Flavobacterium psychrophilum]|uniref:hypothetical protein n=1 Tax=Flavobacterium psychrophilum TaxID=96345 RepID=UPI000B7C52A0|nr:hypothetical protein [Flavobacterium psychrophilum]MCB6062371.1 hypothetical protein [Flavobacterium psychrophilum]SNA85107.1 putative membrane hypothetical protein [Flavobacterium psychrophilum]SNB42327.1 membrane hypothetical protein [Flavobacterium psychrophilum]